MFKDLSVFVGAFPVRVKSNLVASLKAHGAALSYSVTKSTAFAVFPEEEVQRGTSVALNSALRYQIDVVSSAFVEACVQQGKLVDADPFALVRKVTSTSGLTTVRVSLEDGTQPQNTIDPEVFVELPLAAPPPQGFEPFAAHFDLLRQHTLQAERFDGLRTLHVELHVARVAATGIFRVWTQKVEPQTPATGTCTYFTTLRSAEDHYASIVDSALSDDFAHVVLTDRALGSSKALTEGAPDPQLVDLLDVIYTEASHHALSSLDLQHTLTLATVEKAETMFAQIQACVRRGESPAAAVLQTYLKQLPRKQGVQPDLDSPEPLAREEALLQVLRDVLSVRETLGGDATDTAARYAALGCQLTPLASESSDFKEVVALIETSNRRKLPIKVRAVYAFSRPAEDTAYCFEISPRRLLFHGSALANWLGICSRGLLLPRHVEAQGVRRTDAGMLGAGLYFASDASTAAQYSHRGAKSGNRRLMAVAQVATGRCKDFTRVDTSLRSPPVGYDSTRGVPNSGALISDFADEEFVVYNLNRQRLRFLVDFTIEDALDSLLSAGADLAEPETDADATGTAEAMPTPQFVGAAPRVALMRTLGAAQSTTQTPPAAPPKRPPAPLAPQEAGLLSATGEPIALRSVALRSRIVDTVADVVLMQEYYNATRATMEAKYVFPLDDSASVYGFEAFIMGKRVVGVCKEKEQARREYKEAIRKGHGAYLMEKQEKEEVFTISVGNLPPGEACVIKVLYVAELSFDSGAVVFTLPAAVAPTAARAAIADRVQETTQTTAIVAGGVPLNLEVSVETARPIRALRSPTHSLAVKRTDTRAVVRLNDEAATTTGDFTLQIYTEAPHEPRMWVEEDGEHRCAMVSFFPSFEVASAPRLEYSLLLDCSASMSHALPSARRALLATLRQLPEHASVNVILFGTSSHPLLSRAQPASADLKARLEDLVLQRAQQAHLGNTDLAGTLASLLAYAALAPDRLHNVMLFSDGRVPCLEPLCALLRRGSARARLFCFGSGADVSSHSLRTLARWGGGAYVHVVYSRTMIHTTERRIAQQVRRSATPALSNVRVHWGMHEEEAAESVPRRLFSLFSGDRQIVYAFTRASSAELRALNGGVEVHAMVSATEGVRIRGRLLHRLAVRAMVSEHETGVYADDWASHSALKEAQKAPLIARSLEYGIVTPWTSFIAIEERVEGEQRRRQPALSELLDGETVDDMPYLAWPAPLRAAQRLASALESHRRSQREGDAAAAAEATVSAEAALAWLRLAASLLANTGAAPESSDTVEAVGASVASLFEGGSWRSASRKQISSLIEAIGKANSDIGNLATASCPEVQKPAALDACNRQAASLRTSLERLAQLTAPVEHDATASVSEYKCAEVEAALREAKALLDKATSAPSAKEANRASRDDVKFLLRKARLSLKSLRGHGKETELRALLGQVESGLADLGARSAAKLARPVAPDTGALLAWVSQRLPGASVSNLTWAWSNGQLLAGLCSAIRPDDELSSLALQIARKTREEACAGALAAAALWLGVPPLVSAEDMALALNPSALAKYLARLRDVATGALALPPRPVPVSEPIHAPESSHPVEPVEVAPPKPRAKMEPLAPVDHEKWAEKQGQAFVRWANNYLKQKNQEAHSLDDIPALLPALLSCVSGKRLGPSATDASLVQRIDSAAMVLRFLSQEGIKLVNVHAADIARADRKQLLGLLWTVILRYQIQSCSVPISDEQRAELEALYADFDKPSAAAASKRDGLDDLLASLSAPVEPEVYEDEDYADYGEEETVAVVRDKLKDCCAPLARAAYHVEEYKSVARMERVQACRVFDVAEQQMRALKASPVDRLIEMVYVGDDRYDDKHRLIERALASGEWWLITVRVRLPVELTECPTTAQVEAVLSGIRHIGSACDWGVARHFRGGADLCGRLWAAGALESVLQGALKVVQAANGEAIEVVSMRHGSEVMRLHAELHAACAAMRVRTVAEAEVICLRGVAAGLPMAPTTDLLFALRVPLAPFMLHCPRDWSMATWATVIAALIVRMRVSAGREHPLHAPLLAWLSVMLAEHVEPIKGIGAVLGDVPFLRLEDV